MWYSPTSLSIIIFIFIFNYKNIPVFFVFKRNISETLHWTQPLVIAALISPTSAGKPQPAIWLSNSLLSLITRSKYMFVINLKWCCCPFQCTRPPFIPKSLNCLCCSPARWRDSPPQPEQKTRFPDLQCPSTRARQPADYWPQSPSLTSFTFSNSSCVRSSETLQLYEPLPILSTCSQIKIFAKW